MMWVLQSADALGRGLDSRSGPDRFAHRRSSCHVQRLHSSLRLGFATQCTASCIPPRISLIRAHCRESSIHSLHCQAFWPAGSVSRSSIKVELGELILSQIFVRYSALKVGLLLYPILWLVATSTESPYPKVSLSFARSLRHLRIRCRRQSGWRLIAHAHTAVVCIAKLHRRDILRHSACIGRRQ